MEEHLLFKRIFVKIQNIEFSDCIPLRSNVRNDSKTCKSIEPKLFAKNVIWKKPYFSKEDKNTIREGRLTTVKYYESQNIE